jgi:hypothetical protein
LSNNSNKLLRSITNVINRKWIQTINWIKGVNKMKKSEENESAVKDSRFDYLLLFIVTISSIVLVGTLLDSSTQSFVLLVIFGVIDLVAVLTLAGRVFLRTGLECKDEALGLPNGSVRALIALSLIIIFAIMSIYMYTQLTPQQTVWHAGINQTVILGNGTLITPAPNAGVDVILQPSEAQKNFSLQTITTASTLVVALAGFYFGTKAVTTAQERKEEEKKEKAEEETKPKYSLTLTSKNSELPPNGEVIYKDNLEFQVVTSPKDQKYDVALDGADRESLTKSDAPDKYLLLPKNRTKHEITITFTLQSDKTVSKKLTVIFEKLEISPDEASVKQGESIVIDVKAIPEDKEIKYSVTGDSTDSLKPTANKFFIYTPSEIGKGRTSENVFLIFASEGVGMKISKTNHIIVKT